MHAFAYDLEDQGWTVQKLFSQALGLLPRVEYFLLDGNSEVVPGNLFPLPQPGVMTRTSSLPRVLSMAGGSHTLPSGFFGNPLLNDVVFVDVSGLQGAIPGLRHAPARLNVLKMRNRELIDESLRQIARGLRDGLSLWSLDVSDNFLTDRSVTALEDLFHPTKLSSSPRTAEEGALKSAPLPTIYGKCDHVIEESEWSATFSHPQRYLIDPPPWSRSIDNEPQRRIRSSGNTAIIKDTPEATIEALLRTEGQLHRFTEWNQGLTHLAISRNNISAFGIDALLRSGDRASQLEFFACDDMPWFPLDEELLINSFWPSQARLRGICGFAHLFRPVISANLRELRIHHSLVTNLPTLTCGNFSACARAYVAENDILRRVDDAYPQTFSPDMNPRLTSLTLTCIPRRSCGPLIDRLRGFLMLLSKQERDIQDSSPSFASRRNPTMLKGLRYLRLEFDPDTLEDDLYDDGNMEMDALAELEDAGYSFFQGGWSSTSAGPVSRAQDFPDIHEVSKRMKETSLTNQASEKRQGDSAIVSRDGSSEEMPLELWMDVQGSSEHSDRYREVVRARKSFRSVGFPSPAQKIAGIQHEGALVSQLDWAAAVMPCQLHRPSQHQLAGMRDVLCELRQYRQASKAKYDLMKAQVGRPVPLGNPHYFWTGTLQVSTWRS